MPRGSIFLLFLSVVVIWVVEIFAVSCVLPLLCQLLFGFKLAVFSVFFMFSTSVCCRSLFLSSTFSFCLLLFCASLFLSFSLSENMIVGFKSEASNNEVSCLSVQVLGHQGLPG